MHAFLKTGKLGPSSSGTTKPEKKQEKKSTIKPWVEKYRPKNIDEIVYQDEVVAVLRKTLDGADLPNLLFYGPPGTGKTSMILAASRQLFGDIYKDRVLELNASDERGIQVIREKVKTFARIAVSSVKLNGQPCPPFKIIILDEADSMTKAAQAALRRTMEKESKTTRFCLLCNYVSRIIDPITSRCSKFRFKPLPKEVILKHLNYICQTENVSYDDKALDCLIDGSGGDLRRAITCLQFTARLKDKICVADVDEALGTVPKNIIDDFLEMCSSNSFEKLNEFVEDLIMNAYSASQLISQIHDEIVFSSDISEKQKAEILEKIAICDARLCDGADEYLQLMDIGCIIMQQINS